MTENLCISWEEYQKNICKGLGILQQQGEFVDMTLAADGHQVKVHQMVLSLVSPFIKGLIKSTNCPHPIIFLNKVSFQTMLAILEYAYSGEVVVKQDNMAEFLQACNDLHIRGLENMLKKEHIVHGDDTILSNSRKRKRHSSEETHAYDEDDVLHVIENDVLHCQTDEELQEDENEPRDVFAEEKVEDVLTDEKRDRKSKLINHSVLKKAGSIQYSVSMHGNLQMLLNRYIYSYIRTRKDNQRFWRCINQQKMGCLAFVTTFEDRVHERGYPHNHAFHDAQILKRIKKNNVFTKYKEVEDAAAMRKQKQEEADLLKQTTHKKTNE